MLLEPRIIPTDPAPSALDLAAHRLLLASARLGGQGGSRGATWSSNPLPLGQLLGHSLEGGVTVGRLGAPFCRGDDQSGWPVDQPDPGLDLVPVLTARSSGDEELHLTVTLESLPIGGMDRWPLLRYHAPPHSSPAAG